MPEFRVKRVKSIEDSMADVVDLLASAWAKAANLPKGRQILESATLAQRLLCGYYFYWDDVTNGGHLQYFGNYTGNLWQEALEGTRVIRLPEHKILRDAISLFPDNKPGLIQRDRGKQLAKIDSAKFDELDDRFYDLQASGKKIRQYIERHADELFIPGRKKDT
jgi:Domain of unknown function (DUF4375)